MENPRKQPDLSILIPAYNEEAAIGSVLDSLCNNDEIKNAEIIVINDGSTDKTVEIVQQYPRVRLLSHRFNKGYGSAIVSGMFASNGRFVIWFDSDGQHRIEDLIKIRNSLISNNLDYCIGIRDSNSHVEPNRIVGKYILKLAILILTGRQTRDFNSGLRGFRREVLMRYVHLLPKGFGASTTTTLLMLERGYYGKEIPITVLPRKGKSTVNQIRDGYRTIRIISRVLFLFKPFRFFGSMGIVFILIGSIYGINRAISLHQGIPILASLVIILGVQSFFWGLISNQISALRLEELERTTTINDFVEYKS